MKKWLPSILFLAALVGGLIVYGYSTRYEADLHHEAADGLRAADHRRALVLRSQAELAELIEKQPLSQNQIVRAEALLAYLQGEVGDRLNSKVNLRAGIDRETGRFYGMEGFKGPSKREWETLTGRTRGEWAALGWEQPSRRDEAFWEMTK